MPSSGRHFLPIARTTPGWGLTAIKNRLWSFEKGRRTTPPFSFPQTIPEGVRFVARDGVTGRNAGMPR
jgi:hypothetical protein